jgi:cysteine desulfurase
VRRVYLDYAATTPVRPEVLEAMLPYFSERFGNPSSAHQFALEPRQGVTGARREVAAALGCDEDEVIFTAGGTESDNLAVKGCVKATGKGRRHVITSAIEHKAVLESCKALAATGVELTVLPVDGTGRVSPDDLRAALRPHTVLVSIMQANNEVGTLQDLAALAAVCREADVALHTDAVQAFGKVPTGVADQGVTYLSISAHKFYGPKGVGALFVRRGAPLEPIIHGGGHERSRRAGTENVPGIVGLGVAAKLASADLEAETERLAALRGRLWDGISAGIPGVRLNGHPTARLPHLASISIEGIGGVAMIQALESEGMAVSSGSACMSESPVSSHVLAAMGIDGPLAQGTVRFSLGRHTTPDDIDHVTAVLPGVVDRLRRQAKTV